MSIIIKGMDMPKSCKDCPFNSDNAWCLVPGSWRDRYHIPQSGRSEVCPLQYSEDNNDNREFIEILVNNTPNKDKPYYEIHYIENGEHHIGYSSYNIKIVSEYIRDFFIGKRNSLELSDEKHTNSVEVTEECSEVTAMEPLYRKD